MTTKNQDTKFLNEIHTLVRAPLDPASGQPYEKCQYALFPGMALAQSEPELVVLLYDSILHQHPDTAMFLYKGRDGADPLLNRKWSERLLTRWRNLGKPTMILVTPEDMKFFRGILTEIPTVSVYDEMLAHNISGGCNHEMYRISEPAPYGFPEAVKELAEGMGAVLYEPGRAAGEARRGDAANAIPGGESAADTGGEVTSRAAGAESAPLQIDPADVAKIPFLTSSIDVRNAMKKQGFEAVHILELIYGMGRSNQHLESTHEHHHDDAHMQVDLQECDTHDCGGTDSSDHAHGHNAPPQIRETEMSPTEKEALSDLFSPAAQKRNLQELHAMLLSMFWGE